MIWKRTPKTANTRLARSAARRRVTVRWAPVALVTVFLVTVGVLLVRLPVLHRDVLRDGAVREAEGYSRLLSEFRTIYTRDVVEKVRDHQIAAAHEHAGVPGTIPLPATMTTELGKHLGTSDSASTVRLFSDHPFPWRRDREELDDFQSHALRTLKISPDRPVWRIEQHPEGAVIRYATADRMRPACVSCHNSHPDSPKTDWRAGDVRGVLEVTYPVGVLSSGAATSFADVTLMIVLLTVAGGAALIFLMLKSARAARDTREANERLASLVHEKDEARRNADAANRAKTVFLANMSHEIRTPLNAIIGLSSLALESESPDEVRRHLRTVCNSGEVLLAVINDVLDCSKIECGNMELEMVDYDLHELVSGIADILRDMASQNGNVLGVEIDPSAPRYVRGDPGRLRQVLMNLVSNACKFTKSGRVNIAVAGERSDDLVRVRFAVSDTGIGIPAAAQQAIFEPFRQADDSTTRRFGGTGLGLAISRHLVAMMGGELGLDSEVEEGSTFHFEVPLALGGSEGRDGPAPEETAVVRKGARVLIAEDHPVNQLVTRRLLEKIGCVVDVVDDGEKALEAVQIVDYDAIFMDCQMPVLDGFAASRAIRDVGLDVPIIALTASAMQTDRDRCQEAGMVDFVAKPCKAEDLAAALSRVLNG